DSQINIEHQDASVSLKEGILKGVEFLNRVIFHEKPDPIKY
ncbi:MAG: hypothetical protein FJW69_09095, partial [Actinobacteria bacterium]|nr:hypothetical protein [Actinomycetota bacterium]